MNNNPTHPRLLKFTEALEELCKKHKVTLTHNQYSTLFIVDNKSLDYCEYYLDGGFEEF